MILKFIFPILAGISIVLQGTLNRQVAAQIGLVSAVVLNAVVFLVFSVLLWVLVKYNFISGLPGQGANAWGELNWWALLPGIFGFIIVFSTPIAIHYLGANLAFSMVICTQLGASLIWDSVAKKTFPSLMTSAGVLVMLLGVLILIFSRK